MAKKLYIQTRLYNVNDRLASLYLCERVDQIIDQNLLKGFEHCYLPYRDSDAQLPEDVPNPGKEIFDLDVSTLRRCVGVIGNYDGVGYDSGCGFEIGLAYSYGYPINLISTDFMKWNVKTDGTYHTGSPLLEYVAKVVSITEDDKSIKDYRTQQEDLRDRNVNKFLENLIEDFGSDKPSIPLERGEAERDIFLDPCFLDTKIGSENYNKLTKQLEDEEIYFGTSLPDVPEDCIEKLRTSKAAVFYGDVFEHHQDSCILQGIAYGLGIPIIMLCSNRRGYYDGRLKGKKNVMITQSTAKMVETVDQVLGVYREIMGK